MKINLYRQTQGFCGPSSLRIVLDYFGVKLAEKEVAKIIGATRESGCTPEKIINGAKKLGFRAYYEKGTTFKELEDYIKRGPVIIYWNRNGEGHYSVVFDIDKEKVYIADPKLKIKLTLPRESFYKKWRDPESDDRGEVIIVTKR